jgi:hypothetical protein
VTSSIGTRELHHKRCVLRGVFPQDKAIRLLGQLLTLSRHDGHFSDLVAVKEV